MRQLFHDLLALKVLIGGALLGIAIGGFISMLSGLWFVYSGGLSEAYIAMALSNMAIAAK